MTFTISIPCLLQNIVQVCVWLEAGQELPGGESVREKIVLRGQLFTPGLSGANKAKQGGQRQPKCHQVSEESAKAAWYGEDKGQEEEAFAEEAAKDFPDTTSSERAAGPGDILHEDHQRKRLVGRDCPLRP